MGGGIGCCVRGRWRRFVIGFERESGGGNGYEMMVMRIMCG